MTIATLRRTAQQTLRFVRRVYVRACFRFVPPVLRHLKQETVFWLVDALVFDQQSAGQCPRLLQRKQCGFPSTSWRYSILGGTGGLPDINMSVFYALFRDGYFYMQHTVFSELPKYGGNVLSCRPRARGLKPISIPQNC